jgi:thioesterase domain-containing protein
VAALWQRLLHVERVGVRDRFAALGGDSLLAVRMLLEVSEAEGVGAAFARFLDEGTVEAIAAEVAEWCAGRAVPGAPVAIQSAGSRRPLFCVPGHDGTLVGISRLARALGPDQPVWAFPLAEPAHGIADLARRCVERMSPLAGGQRHRLAGVCFGGLVALEMARQLREAGEQVELVALIDTLNPAWRRDQRPAAVAASVARQLRAKVAYHATVLRGMGAWGGTGYLAGRARAFLQNHGERAGARALRLGLELPGSLRSVRWAHRRMALDHRPGIYPGDVLIVKAPGRRPDVPALGWRGTILGILEEVEVPFHPAGALAADSAARVAEALSRRLR